MKHLFVFATTILVILFHFGCGSDEDMKEPTVTPSTIEENDKTETTAVNGKVELKNMYEDEVISLPKDSILELVTVIEGSAKEIIPVRFRGIRDFGIGFPLYECELIDETVDKLGGIAQGMSGSPVGPPGRVMGALAYGDAFSQTPQRFWVTSIDAMENAIDHLTFGNLLEDISAAPSGILSSTYEPVKTPMMITGIRPHRLEQISKQLNKSRFQSIELYSHIPSVSTGSTHVFDGDLGAGDMIGVAIVTGDIVNSIGYGTVTQVFDEKFIAFGHPMFGEGKSSLPVYRATVEGLVSNLQISYKSVTATGDPIGTITKDLTPAIVGELGPIPDMIPIIVSYHPSNLDSPVKKRHQVAFGQESVIPLVAALTMDAIKMEISPGTISCEVELEFKETDRDFSRTFISISADPFIDLYLNIGSIVSGFTNYLDNSAGKATLEEVTISITEQPQIFHADINEVTGPKQIRRGTSATFTIELLPHWSSADDDRTIIKEVTLNIPSNFPLGNASLRVSGGASSKSGDDLFFEDFSFDFDFDDTVPELPKDLDDLIRLEEDKQTEPSSIKVVLRPPSDESFGFNNFDDVPEGSIEQEVDLEGYVVTGSHIKSIEIQSE